MKERKEARRKYLNILITLYCAHVCIHYVNISLYFDAFIIINCIFLFFLSPIRCIYGTLKKNEQKRERKEKSRNTNKILLFYSTNDRTHLMLIITHTKYTIYLCVCRWSYLIRANIVLLVCNLYINTPYSRIHIAYTLDHNELRICEKS